LAIPFAVRVQPGIGNIKMSGAFSHHLHTLRLRFDFPYFRSDVGIFPHGVFADHIKDDTCSHLDTSLSKKFILRDTAHKKSPSSSMT